ncbi:uncharacterized protein UV8b_04782 [Ustilaginoidea virens]|uniref:Uncharacterized protein n=1 Tax=Ustilaginoidea virens TaxID=1159556 RepID=A0A8E5MIB3_USTVR|nr:uncharacterized protein UV8b_04782 [Ustilaginoidea virens]QUC20541.1 hypothetical protein UV8b_04782 [Ustilaginoidea virens]
MWLRTRGFAPATWPPSKPPPALRRYVPSGHRASLPCPALPCPALPCPALQHPSVATTLALRIEHISQGCTIAMPCHGLRLSTRNPTTPPRTCTAHAQHSTCICHQAFAASTQHPAPNTTTPR